jgi:hypothetical protein
MKTPESSFMILSDPAKHLGQFLSPGRVNPGLFSRLGMAKLAKSALG